MKSIKPHIPVLIGLCSILFIQALILWPYRDFIQVWDGYWYWHLCLRASLGETFNFMDFNCSDHPNMGFFLPIALFIRSRILDPQVSLLIYQWALTAISIPLFYGIARSLYKSPSPPLIPILTTFAWSMHPLLLADTLVTSPELGSMVYMLACLWAFCSNRFWLISIFGTLFVFTKEPMILMYVLGFILVTLSYLPQVSFFPSIFLGCYRLLRKVTIFLIPLGALVIYAYIRVFIYNLNLFHGANSNDSQLQITAGTFLQIFSLSTRQIGILVMVFFNSFMGIPTLLVALSFAKWCYASFRNSSLVKVSPITLKVTLTFVLGLYSLTRIIPYTNSRYLLPLVPLILLLTPVSIAYLNISRKFNALILLIIAGLFYQSQSRSLDPMAKWFFGTFDIGAFKVLNVTSYSGECCGGNGRDQLVYNLQFTKIFELQDLVYAAIKPTSDTTIVYHDESLYFTTGPLDPITFKRTDQATNLMPKFIGHSAIDKSINKEFYFIGAPNTNSQPVLENLQGKYHLKETKQVNKQDYVINFFKFEIN